MLLLAFSSNQCIDSLIRSFKNLLVLEGRFLSTNVHGGHNITEFRHTLGVSAFIVIPVGEAVERRSKEGENNDRERSTRPHHTGTSAVRYYTILICDAVQHLPGINLDHCSVNDLSRQGINNATARVVGIIRRNERLGFVPHDTGQRTGLTRLFQSFVDLFLGNGCFDFKDTVGQTGI